MAAAAVESGNNHITIDDEDDYFNDLSQQNGQTADEIPKAKRIACVLCRKRKLKCDGIKPSCGTCKRLSHDCSYDEVRKKSGPKRGYVRQLEARLAQVETMLKSGDLPQPNAPNRTASSQSSPDQMNDINLAESFPTSYASRAAGTNITPNAPPPPAKELMTLDLEEPLPTQNIIDDLNRIYFEKVHPVAPLIHPGRYYAAMSLDPHQRPPICLRYAMWAMTASVVDKYEDLQEHFYKRARKYIERDEMRGHGESIVTVQHVQTWYILSMLEFKMTYFPRAWMSTGRACRLAVMMGLHRLDFAGLEVKQCLPPPRDWTDKEERRRTFWMCFTADRFASIGTGWPMTIDENDIRTNLPSDDNAFEQSREVPTVSLQRALEADGSTKMSSSAGVMVMACLFGRNLVHLHRGTPEDNERNLNGKFWTRHRSLDNLLLNIALTLPDHLRLPSGINDQNTIFLNLCIHTSVICLHQAAIFKADANKLPGTIASESKIRCITAAAEIASIMRMISHMDLTNANPFSTFCLYVAARVFVQYLKSRPTDSNVKASLHFLLTAMQAMRRKNLLTESLLVQLDIDLQAAGLEESRSLRNRLAKLGGVAPMQASKMCTSMQEMAESPSSTTSSKPPVPRGHAFGDNTLQYLSQAAAPRAGESRVQSVSDSASPPVFNGTGADFPRVRFMPTRTKTPSTRPSPATVSDENMDFTGDAFDSASPGSFNGLSSHTSSISQQTPPLLNHRDTQSSTWSNEKPLFTPTTTADNNPMNTNNIMSNDEFQAMINQYTDSIYTDNNTFNDPMNNTIMGGTSEDTAFTMPNFNLDQSLNVPSGLDSTGFAPGPSSGGDLLAMSDEEWKQIVDSGMVDMGWNGTFLSDRGTQGDARWKPGV
ncbi:Fungal specific transcription factor domain-containing protein 68 [Elsinoe fawcettii]|nr:Fungal specific transcription factor domain-containing protein 68 [Elsinoe fawcettii]